MRQGVIANTSFDSYWGCWCGCGKETERGSFFLPGHDKIAESAVLLIEYGGVPEFLAGHGYTPGGRNPRKALEAWRNRVKARRSEMKRKPKTLDQ